MRKFIIARHGNTFGPGQPARRIGVKTDLPLTTEGRAQAQALADAFSTCRLRPELILCGTLQRSRDTATIIADRLRLADPALADWLNEIDHGPDEDRCEADVLARIGEKALAAWDQEGIAPAGWNVDEPTRLNGWRTLFASSGSATTLLVTSNGAARFALLAEPALRDSRSLKLRTGAYGIIEQTNAGSLLLIDWDVRP